MKSFRTFLMLFILPVILLSWVERVQSSDNANSPESPAQVQDDYYSSLIGVQNLAKKEHKFVTKVVSYKKKLEETLDIIDFYLEDYSKCTNSIIKKDPELRDKYGKRKYPRFKTEMDLQRISEHISGNPLMVFKFLRRFCIELTEVEKNMVNIDHHSEFKEYIHDFERTTKFPTLSDLLGAADGLLRLQVTYQLPTNAMSNGVLIERKTGCKLQASDMQFIGVRAINEKLFASGMEWLYRAYENVLHGDDSLSMETVQGQLLKGRTIHNSELLKFDPESSNLFTNLVNSTFTNIPDLFIKPAIWDYPIGHTYDTIYDIYNFNALCRGEQLLSPQETKDLRCWYSHANSPYNIISPLKFEMHHENPPVFQVYDLISNTLINRIRNESMPHLKRSKVVSVQSGGAKSDVRTSSVAWLGDISVNSSVSRVRRIVNKATGLKCDSAKSVEELQVSCYGSVGGYYIPHLDSLIHSRVRQNPEAMEELKKGDRVATVMFYLSDVELGGGTSFPRLGVAAKPVKGSAVIWYNLKKNGIRNPLMLHGGCPVLYGNKWVANKWIRLYEQLHIHKCGKLKSE